MTHLHPQIDLYGQSDCLRFPKMIPWKHHPPLVNGCRMIHLHPQIDLCGQSNYWKSPKKIPWKHR